MTSVGSTAVGLWLLAVGAGWGFADFTPGSDGQDTLISHENEVTPTLLELLESYLQTDDPSERASLAESIEQDAGDDPDAIAEALGRVQLWKPFPENHGVISFETGFPGITTVTYDLPESYDPADRHGLILCMPHPGMSPTEAVALAGHALGSAAREFVLVSPDRPVDGSFHQDRSSAGVLRRLMRLLRRRIHLDTDRVFLFGVGEGGDAAWMAGLTHPDLFAGAIVLSAHPHLPYPRQVYPFLLENLRRLPLLSVYAAAEGDPPQTRSEKVAAYNRAIVRLAAEKSLPIVGVEITATAPGVLKPPADRVAAMLAGRRPPSAGEVSLWFRYPAQGHAGWLRQTKFMHDVWEADQLSILASPATDHDRYITDVIQDKLAFLGARVDGQTITIETRRCARIELLIPQGLVDFSIPITVRCNGRKRYDRMIQPSIRTMLETAYQDWEFQHPAVARLSFNIKSSAKD